MAYSYEPHPFEAFEEGQTFRSPGRTITETDVVMHAATTGDWNELHTNREHAAEREFGERIVHGPLTFTQAIGMLMRIGMLERTAYAFLGMESVQFPNPVYVDDTIQLEASVAETRDLESRDDVGLVVFDAEVTTQEETVVLEADMRFFVRRADEVASDLRD